jgi:glucose-1-phosphate cytidylyltransferase
VSNDEESPLLVVLAGGRGSRLGGLTETLPKPLVEIGDRPMLWHVLMSYAAAGVGRAIVAAGYRADQIRLAFADIAAIDVVDTGLSTNTGGRVRRLAAHLPETFCLTYGDGLSDVAIADVIDFHMQHGRIATITAVHPPARFGVLSLSDGCVSEFTEKPRVDDVWINGGFMVFQRDVVDWIADDASSLERDVLEKLAAEGELMAFRHEGFWQCMDTPADLEHLTGLWNQGNAPWRTW